MPEEVCPTCGGRGVVPEFKVCANEYCAKGRPGPAVFRWQDGRAGRKKRTKGVLYCSDRCAKAVAQRRFRERQAAQYDGNSER